MPFKYCYNMAYYGDEGLAGDERWLAWAHTRFVYGTSKGPKKDFLCRCSPSRQSPNRSSDCPREESREMDGMGWVLVRGEESTSSPIMIAFISR